MLFSKAETANKHNITQGTKPPQYSHTQQRTLLALAHSHSSCPLRCQSTRRPGLRPRKKGEGHTMLVPQQQQPHTLPHGGRSCRRRGGAWRWVGATKKIPAPSRHAGSAVPATHTRVRPCFPIRCNRTRNGGGCGGIGPHSASSCWSCRRVHDVLSQVELTAPATSWVRDRTPCATNTCCR